MSSCIINDSNENICPICHENIDFNKPESYIIFNCCNQMSHLNCLISWTNSVFTKSIKYNNRYTCIMCQKPSEFTQDIAQNICTQNIQDQSINCIQNINIETSENDSNTSDNIIDSNNYNDMQEYNRQKLYNCCRNTANKIYTYGGALLFIVSIPLIILVIL